jgi:phospholipid/cholesterol/gamma-HCH transport system permease protein
MDVQANGIKLLGSVGGYIVGQVRRRVHLFTLLYSVVALACRPSTWRRTVRVVLARQVVFTGVDALKFTASVALFIGVAVVVQAQLWFGRLGQPELVGPLLVTVIVREVGPLLANLIVIQRSGNAIAVEMANMRASGEVRLLDAQGLDPLVYLVVPRTIGLTISLLCLSVWMIAVSFVGGYLFAVLAGVKIDAPATFLTTIVGSIGPADALSVAGKAVIPGLLAGAICCSEGLSVEGSATEIPQVVTRGVQRSVVAMFLVSMLISVLTYW